MPQRHPDTGQPPAAIGEPRGPMLLVSGANLRLQRFYDRLAPWYDAGSALHQFLNPATRRWRAEYLRELPVTAQSRVLEVCVGTGANLVQLPAFGEFVGIDLSAGMLRRCQRKVPPGRAVTLCRALAESQPFDDHAFDVVFNVGDINLFSDTRRALSEMVRVARPGAFVLIVDATERFARRYERHPLLGHVYRHRARPLEPPVGLLPRGVENIRVREFAGGELFCLTFRKAHDSTTPRDGLNFPARP